MATGLSLSDSESEHGADIDFVALPNRITPVLPDTDFQSQLQSLRADMDDLKQCVRDTVELQRSMLGHLGNGGQGQGHAMSTPVPIAASTPCVPSVAGRAKLTYETPSVSSPRGTTEQTRVRDTDLNATARMLAAALHQVNLEPAVFTGRGSIRPSDWLRSVNAYRSSLGLSDEQILTELPRFLAGEPGVWFSSLALHVTSWAEFTDLFRMVFSPADDQEQIMRGILDRFQAPKEPLPTFVAYMLNEFKRMRNPPPEQEQIELICRHALEKYRIALFGADIRSPIDLVMRAHELHAVLGPCVARPSAASTANIYCFGCSAPGYTLNTCPSCSSAPQGGPSSYVPRNSPRPPLEMGPSGSESRSSGRGRGFSRGARASRRNFPTRTSPPPMPPDQQVQPDVGQLLGEGLQSLWTDPFRVKVNYNGEDYWLGGNFSQP